MRGEFTMHDLVLEFRLSRKTIHRYIKIGVLPPPVGERRWATYTQEHWRRLREIQRVKDETVTLGDLKERFTGHADD